jgi:hypothetical protein
MSRLLSSLALLACTAVLAHAEAPAKAVELFNGQDLSGWEYITPDKTATLTTVCAVKPDGVLAVAGKPVGYLATKNSYGNYRLHVEYRWPADAAKNSNGGVLVHIASGPIDRNTWPLCLQVQTKLTRFGDLLPMAGAAFAEPLTSAPGKTQQLDRQKPDSEKPLGEWNAIDVVCRGDTVEVSINGVAQNRVTGSKPAAGKIGFQLEGMPYELRNVRFTPLD